MNYRYPPHRNIGDSAYLMNYRYPTHRNIGVSPYLMNYRYPPHRNIGVSPYLMNYRYPPHRNIGVSPYLINYRYPPHRNIGVSPCLRNGPTLGFPISMLGWSSSVFVCPVPNFRSVKNTIFLVVICWRWTCAMTTFLQQLSRVEDLVGTDGHLALICMCVCMCII
jgi:hypothetical protein